MCSIPQRGAKRNRTHSEAARWQGTEKIKPPLRGAYFGGPEGISPARGDKLRLPQAHGKNKSTLAGGLFLVDLKGFEPSTSRMRTERSPKADILHPHTFDSLNFCTILLNSRLIQQENVISAVRHIWPALFKKIQVSIIFCLSLRTTTIVFCYTQDRKRRTDASVLPK